MDWSLVLVSQGIETSIERDAESGVWLLVVTEPDHARAVDALRRYQIENRTPLWQHRLPAVGLLFDLRSLGWLLFLGLMFALETTGHGNWQLLGRMDNAMVHAGQWWRLFTGVTLHADVTHLAFNLSTGLLLMGLAMGAYGYGVGLLVPYLAGVAGFLAGFVVNPAGYQSLGASGMILGALGLLSAQWIELFRRGFTAKQAAARGVASGCLLLVLLGFNPAENTDVLAHVAGFVSALLLGTALAFCPERFTRGPWPNRTALALTLALVLGSWWLALRR